MKGLKDMEDASLDKTIDELNKLTMTLQEKANNSNLNLNQPIDNKIYMLYVNSNERMELVLNSDNTFIQFVSNGEKYTILKGKYSYQNNKLEFLYKSKKKENLYQNIDNKEIYNVIYTNNKLTSVFINNKELKISSSENMEGINNYTNIVKIKEKKYFKYLAFDKTGKESYRQEIILYPNHTFEEFIGVPTNSVLFKGRYNINEDINTINMQYLSKQEINKDMEGMNDDHTFGIFIKNKTLNNIMIGFTTLESANEFDMKGIASYKDNDQISIENILGEPVINQTYFLNDKILTSKALQEMIKYTKMYPNKRIKLSNCVIDNERNDYIDIYQGNMNKSTIKIK